MKLSNKLYRIILNFPEAEMTVTDILEALGSGANPQTVRVTVCKMAAGRFFLEKTGRRKGREMLYKKCRDIHNQWQWMNKNRTAGGRYPSPAVSVRSITRSEKPVARPVPPAPVPPTIDRAPNRRQANDPSLDPIFQILQDLSKALKSQDKLNAIESRLKRVEQAVQRNDALISSLAAEFTI